MTLVPLIAIFPQNRYHYLMIKRFPILALFDADHLFQKFAFEKLKETFHDLFLMDIIDQKESYVINNYSGVFSFSSLEVTCPLLLFSEQETGDDLSFYISPSTFENGQSSLDLSRHLIQFFQQLNDALLNQFPYQMRLAHQNGDFIWHNQQFNGSFFPDQESTLEAWILSQFQNQKNLSEKHFLLPSASLDHIYFQSYFALRNQEGQYLGSFDMVQDLKPILAQYLEETAQAIVGWSDVTSGPSISNN